MEELLTYSHVDVSFRGNTVVHDVSFSLHKGEILGIVGGIRKRKKHIAKGRDGIAWKGWYGNAGRYFFQWAGHPGSVGKTATDHMRSRNWYDIPGCGSFVKSHTYHRCADP